MTAAANRDFDLIVIGGGLVGLTLACALGESSFEIALLDQAEFPEKAPSGEPGQRVSAITRASRNILAGIGAWDAVDQSRLGPFRGMRVWDANGGGSISFDCADAGAAELGWIIENRVVQHALLTRCRELPNVHLLGSHRAQAVDWCEDEVVLELQSGSRLATRLLVGADGAGSKVRELAGIDTLGWDYAQSGVVATVSCEYSHDQVARQRFLDTGPLAFLPLYDGQCSIVWSTPSDESERLLALPAEGFEAELEAAFDHCLGALRLTSARAGFPLKLQHARRYVGGRVALIGDAAHTIHPLAGQGVNLGFLDAAALAEVLLAGAARGRDCGSIKVLRRYERWRKGHNVLVQGVMDVFKRLYGSQLPPLRVARNLGMQFTDAVGPIKLRIMRLAMGLEGDLPVLAREHRAAPI